MKKVMTAAKRKKATALARKYYNQSLLDCLDWDGMTPADLGRAVDVSYVTAYSWAARRVLPKPYHALLIASSFNTTIEEMLQTDRWITGKRHPAEKVPKLNEWATVARFPEVLPVRFGFKFSAHLNHWKRKHEHMTIVDFANLVMSHEVVVRRWKTGKMCPNVDTMARIGAVLNCSIPDLLI